MTKIKTTHRTPDSTIYMKLGQMKTSATFSLSSTNLHLDMQVLVSMSVCIVSVECSSLKLPVTSTQYYIIAVYRPHSCTVQDLIGCCYKIKKKNFTFELSTCPNKFQDITLYYNCDKCHNFMKIQKVYYFWVKEVTFTLQISIQSWHQAVYIQFRRNINCSNLYINEKRIFL